MCRFVDIINSINTQLRARNTHIIDVGMYLPNLCHATCREQRENDWMQ